MLGFVPASGSGPAGRGISSTEIVSGHLVLHYSDGSQSDAGPVTGAAGRGLTGAQISGGHLVLTYSDGTTADVGQVVGTNGAAARGISSTAINAGHLVVTYTDGSTSDLGQVVGTNGSSASIASLRRVYVSSVEITSSVASYDFASNVPAGATEVEVECVGGGASGWSGRSDGSCSGNGGEPGQVVRRRLRVAEIVSPIAVTVGAGGALRTSFSTLCLCNPGTSTSFGSLLTALAGNAAGSGAATPTTFARGFFGVHGDVSSGPAGYNDNPGSTKSAESTNRSWPENRLAAVPSQGPGGGGAALPPGSDSYQNAGSGGDSGVHLPASKKAGGLSQANSYGTGATPSGASATDVWGYGAGGAGGTSQYATGGSGGLPGGGGGGAYTSGAGGAGGRGAVRLHFYRYEAS